MAFDFDTIKEEKKIEIQKLKTKRSLISAIEKTRENGLAPIISEIKRASPSKGKIRDVDIAASALEMEEGGACAISVLTDKYFGGNIGDLAKVKGVVKIPVLRKDFIVDEFQLEQSSLVGADAILLIASLLKNQVKKFVGKARQLGMEALVEIRSEEEIKFALDSGAKLIGINNRDLKTMKVDLTKAQKLIQKIPGDRIIVSESGVHNEKDLAMILKAGAKAALIGTSIMLSKNIKSKVEEFVRSVK